MKKEDCLSSCLLSIGDYRCHRLYFRIIEVDLQMYYPGKSEKILLKQVLLNGEEQGAPAAFLTKPASDLYP